MFGLYKVSDQELKEILDIKERLSKILRSERKNLKNSIKTKDYIFFDPYNNNLAYDYPKDAQLIDLYGFMDTEYCIILSLIESLYSAININTLDSLDTFLVNPIILATIMRSTLEESAQLRFIFYKEDHRSLHFKANKIKSITDATDILSQKNKKLFNIFKDFQTNYKWLAEEYYVTTLIYNYLPFEYKRLYKNLCAYNHNSKVVTNSEDIKWLLIDLETLILPLITDFSNIYNYYFMVEFNELFDPRKNKTI